MDYYNVLGLQSSATDSEIKKAWRELSFKYHPDKNVKSSDFEKKDNEKKIKELNESYETLKDPLKKQQYDNRNMNPFQNILEDLMKRNQFNTMNHNQMNHNPFQKSPFQNQRVNIFDFINLNEMEEPMVFTTMYEDTPITRQKSKPLIHPIEVKLVITLEQSFKGAQVPVTVEREISNGVSYTEQERIYVTVPKGVDTDEIITISEKGNETNGVKGDIKIQIFIKHHEVFERNGLNIIYNHTITFKESIVGFNFSLDHIDTNSFRLKSSRGNVIQNMEEKIIKGKGFERDGSTGDLIVVFKVTSPSQLTEEQLVEFDKLL